MCLLNTNVVSELRHPRPHDAVLDWIVIPAKLPFVSPVTVDEIQAGIENRMEPRQMNRKPGSESWGFPWCVVDDRICVPGVDAAHAPEGRQAGTKMP